MHPDVEVHVCVDVCVGLYGSNWQQPALITQGRLVRALLVDIGAESALARLLKTSPQFWMRLQADGDLHQAMQREARKVS